MSTTVSSPGQITIPKRVRDLLGIVPGSMIDFQRAPDGRIALVKLGCAGLQRIEHRRDHGPNARRIVTSAA